MDVSIFDLDRTLTRIGTYTPFLIFAALHRAPWRLVLLPIWFLAIGLYGLGLLRRKPLKEFGFLLLIGRRIPNVKLTVIARNFANVMIATNIPRSVRQHLATEKQRGAVLMLATAAPDFYAQEIATKLGFQIVVATRQERLDHGDIGFRIDGDNCYGTAKFRMVEKSWASEPLLREANHIAFYSDSASDAPLLHWAKTGFAVNPSRRLRKLAQKHGWSILHFA